jgi:ABC-type glycerol-3-phosphate transport system substrate-binding protein
VGEEQGAAARQAVEEAILISPEAANATPALEYLSRAVQEILAGAATPEEALRAAQQQAESAAP